MRCVCCRSPVDEEKVCCPRCGFPLLGGDQENRRRIAGDYRKKLLGDTFLSVRQYFYGYDSDGDLQELKSEYVRAACAGELPPEGIRWLDTEFAPLASGRDVELEIQRYSLIRIKLEVHFNGIFFKKKQRPESCQ